MRWIALAGLFVLAFVVFAAAWAPLSPVLRLAKAPEHGVAWAAASGTIWRGEIAGLRVREQDIGDLTLLTDPWSLVGLGVKANVRAAGPIAVRGALRVGLDGAISAEDATIAIDLARWRGARAEIARSGGEVFVSIRRLELDRSGACRSADGSARTDALVRLAAGQPLAWRAPELQGPLTCDAGALRLSLTGDSEAGAVEATLTFDPAKLAGTFAATAQSDEPGAAVSLGLLGFIETKRGRFEFERGLP